MPKPDETAITKLTLRPVVYTVNGCPLREPVTIEQRSAFPTKWVAANCRGVLNTDGEFEYEPSPSNRDPDFIARTRFDSPLEALANLKKHLPNFGEQWFPQPSGTISNDL